MYVKSSSKVYFIGVSEDNEIKALQLSENTKFNKIIEQNFIKLKGIRNILVVNNKNLLVETANEVMRYDVWDLVDPYTDQTLAAQRKPEGELVL